MATVSRLYAADVAIYTFLAARLCCSFKMPRLCIFEGTQVEVALEIASDQTVPDKWDL